MTALQKGQRKLSELRRLLALWRIALVAVAAAAVIIIWMQLRLASPFAADATANTVTLFGILLTAIGGILSMVTTRFLELKQHYIEIENGIIDDEDLKNKRLIAFHAEIEGNLAVLAKTYARERRQELISRLLSNPHGKRFTRSDPTNPIFEDNRAHIYQFSRRVIETATSFYNLESNLNLAVDAFLLPEFAELSERQKLSWFVHMFRLADDMARAAGEALRAIESELGKEWSRPASATAGITVPAYAAEPPLRWHAVSEKELEPIMKRIAKLGKRPSPKRPPAAGARNARR